MKHRNSKHFHIIYLKFEILYPALKYIFITIVLKYLVMPYFRITVCTKKKIYQGIRYMEQRDVEYAQLYWRKLAKERFDDFLDIEVALLPRYCTAVKDYVFSRLSIYKVP